MALFHSKHSLRNGLFILDAIVFIFLLNGHSVQAEVIVRDLDSNNTAAIFPDMQASFGDDFPKHGLEGRVIFAEPRTACGTIKPAPHKQDNSGWIVLIARGGCPFTEKVLNAQRANFCSAIVYNYKGIQGLTKMGGDDGTDVSIPSTFVGYNSGMDLGSQYSYRHPDYIIRIEEEEEIDYRMYLWPFAIVVGVCFLMIMLFLIIKFVRDHTRNRVARLSKKHLKKIPIRKFKKGQYYDTCAVCLDEYEDGEKIRVLPCDHAYHAKCIDPWLTRNKKTCPVCKRRVMPGKDNSEDSGSESEGGSASSQTTPLLLNSSSRSHGSLNQGDGDGVQTQRAQSAPAMFESAVILEEEGAVGGVGISPPQDGSSGKTDLERGEQREGRRKKKERRDENKDSSVSIGAEDEEEQRKLDRRERRKKKKDKKKREERRSRRSAEDDRDGETSRLVVEAQVENDASANRGAAAVGLVGDDDDDDDEQGYINPSYSESQEVVVPTPKGKKRELSEVV